MKTERNQEMENGIGRKNTGMFHPFLHTLLNAQRRRMIAGLLIISMILSLMPASPTMAEETMQVEQTAEKTSLPALDLSIWDGSIMISAGRDGMLSVRQSGTTYEIPAETEIMLTGTNGFANLACDGVTANITLNGAGIILDGGDKSKWPYNYATPEAMSGSKGDSAIVLMNGANVTFTLAENTTSTLLGGVGCPGIWVSEDSTVTITGKGTLDVTGGHCAAAIGGDAWSNTGIINIMGGIVNATSGADGAAIGGGHANDTPNNIRCYGNFKEINISGGQVNAKSTRNGAAIGGGCWSKSNEGIIRITGGIVNAEVTGSNVKGVAAIGRGHNGGDTMEVAELKLENCIVYAENENGRIFSDAADSTVPAAESGEYNSVYGNVTLDGDYIVPEGKTLIIPEGSSLTVTGKLTVSEGSKLIVQGDVNSSSLENYGTVEKKRPDAPTLASMDKTTVTLTAVEGHQYGWSLTDDGKTVENWQDSPEFTYTEEELGKTYYFFLKNSAYSDTDYESSVSVSLKVQTYSRQNELAAPLSINESSIVIEKDGDSLRVTHESTIYTLSAGTKISVTGNGTAASNQIVVKNGASADVTIEDVNIDTTAGSAIDIESGAALNLTLKGENVLKPACAKAGIHVPEGASLVVDGDGSLDVSGGRDGGTAGGAGIGADRSGSLGSITINGGNINAHAVNTGGAGIGVGGWGGSGRQITINGGHIIASGLGNELSFCTLSGTCDAVISGGIIEVDDNRLDSVNKTNCLIRKGNDWTVYGSYTLAENFTVEAGKTVTISDGSALTIGEKAMLTNAGTITVKKGGELIVLGNAEDTDSGKLVVETDGTVVKKKLPVPAAPTASQINATRISLNETAGVQYGIKKAENGNIEWQDSPVFTRLKPGTDYWFFIKAVVPDANIDYITATESPAAKIVTEAYQTELPAEGFSIASSTIVIEKSDVDGYICVNNGIHVYRIPNTTSIMVTGSEEASANQIVIRGGAAANVTIKDVYIDTTNGSAIDIEGGAVLNLNIEGNNVLKPARQKAGIHVSAGALLVIDGSGSLDVTGGRSGPQVGGAGIGANWSESAGRITINGGNITARAVNMSGAGIGTGSGSGACYAGRITITGGHIIASGGGFHDEYSFCTSIRSPYNCDVVISGGIIEVDDNKLDNVAKENCLIRKGNDWTVYGSFTMTENWTLEAGKTLTISAGSILTNKAELTISSGSTLTVLGYAENADNGKLVVEEGGTVEKGKLPVPAAPTDAEVGAMRIALKETAGVQYGIKKAENGNIEWQDSPVFTGLEEGTIYWFYTKALTTEANTDYVTETISEAVVIAARECKMTLPAEGLSAASGSIEIEKSETEGINYIRYGDNCYRIPNTTSIMVTGSTTENHLVADGVTANITLNGVSIIHTDGSGDPGKTAAAENFATAGTCAVELKNGANITLTLEGENTLQSGVGRAGIWVPVDSIVTIAGEGTLNATGSHCSAGIGGDAWSNAGIINITGGIVNAIGGGDGAGIGGGHANDAAGRIYGQFKEINITGGQVKAIAGGNAAAIGSGCWCQSADGIIRITGGVVYAETMSSLDGVAAIGRGYNRGNYPIKELTIDKCIVYARNCNNGYVFAADANGTRPSDQKNGEYNAVYGNLTLNEDYTVPKGETLTIPAGSTLTNKAVLTVSSGSTLIVLGYAENADNGKLNVENGGTVVKGKVPALAAPTASKISALRIALKETASVQYGIKKAENAAIEWQDSPVFTGLEQGTTYWFFTRMLPTEANTDYIAVTISEAAEIATLACKTTLPAEGISVASGSIEIEKANEDGSLVCIKHGDKFYLIPNTTRITITGTTTTNRVIVDNAAAKITLDGASICLYSGCAFELKNSADVTLTLKGTSDIQSWIDYAGICVPENSTITIDGNGKLNVTGKGFGAGIGSIFERKAGIINIKSGIVNAVAEDYGAGIGGGVHASFQEINLTGGFITAISLSSCAIGNGNNFVGTNDEGTIVIKDCIVKTSTNWGTKVGYSVYGNVTLTENYTLQPNDTLVIPEDAALINAAVLTVSEGSTLTVLGYAENTGSGKLNVVDGGKVVKKTASAPTASQIGSKSIVLKEMTGVQYGIKKTADGKIEWQDSPVFTGLEIETTYWFFNRMVPTEANKDYVSDSSSEAAEIATLAYDTILPAEGLSAVSGSIEIEKDAEDGIICIRHGDSSYRIPDTTQIMVTGGEEAAANPIVIRSGVTANVTIKDVNIDITEGSAIDIESGATLNLTLEGENVLKSASDKAGIHVPEGAVLTIGGDGSLNISGGAGIGADQSEQPGSITITGGSFNTAPDAAFIAEGLCVAEKNGIYVVAAHDLEHHAAVDPTEAAEGNKEYWSCRNCGKLFSDEEGRNEVGLGDVTIAKLIRVTISSDKYNITINGSEKSNDTSELYAPGTEIELVALNPEYFAYWSVGDVCVSKNPTYTFIVSTRMELKAVYNTPVTQKTIVEWQSAYGQIMQRDQYAAGDIIVEPGLPTRLGYTTVGWDMSIDEIREEIAKGVESIVVTAQYTLDAITFNITVTNGSGSGTYTQNDVVTAIADEPASGMKFSHWEDASGSVLGYEATYKFYASQDYTVKAVYVEEENVVEAKGTAEIIEIRRDGTNIKISFVAMLTVPQDCKISYAGVVATNDPAAAENLTTDNALYVRGTSTPGTAAHRYTWTKGNVTEDQTWYARAYLVYVDAQGVSHTVYGELVTASLED